MELTESQQTILMDLFDHGYTGAVIHWKVLQSLEEKRLVKTTRKRWPFNSVTSVRLTPVGRKAASKINYRGG